MSYMLEVYYREPADEVREGCAAQCASTHGGRLGYREGPARAGGPVCLTFEFAGLDDAQRAAEALRSRGEHVEGPAEYGA